MRRFRRSRSVKYAPRQPFPARHEQVEQDRAPAVLVHLDQLARSTATYLRDDHQPHRQHHQPRWPRRPRPTRSSPLSDRQEGLGQGVPFAEHRARRVSRRLELRHQTARSGQLIGRLTHSRALNSVAYHDEPLTVGTTYTYMVMSLNAAGQAESNEVTYVHQ